jgi:hypothetical protein
LIRLQTLFSIILNGLEFAGGLRESADLRKHKFTPARAAENGCDRDGPLNLCSRSATTADGKFTASIFWLLFDQAKSISEHSGKACYRDTWFYLL